MSVATPPAKPGAPTNGQPSQEPPDENFWEKYSPHHEFPISTFATGVIHVCIVALIIYITTQLMKPDETTPVPIRSMVVVREASLGGNGGEAGSGGGETKRDVEDERPPETKRAIPEAELQKEIARAATIFVEIKDPEALKTLVEGPNFSKFEAVNEQIRKHIAKGFTGKPGTGDNMGSGASGEAGKGPGGAGDPTSSGSRGNRWIITFKTSNGEDYLRQLAAFEAQLIVPEPSNWKRNRLFADISVASPGKLLGDEDDLPSFCFVDDDKASARKIAQALGLNYAPPRFLAFFPKKVEDDLAAKERAYRGRGEGQIHATTFSVIERNGKFEVKVTDQVAARR